MSILLYFESILVYFESILCTSTMWQYHCFLWKHRFVAWYLCTWKIYYSTWKVYSLPWEYSCVLWNYTLVLWKYNVWLWAWTNAKFRPVQNRIWKISQATLALLTCLLSLALGERKLQTCTKTNFKDLLATRALLNFQTCTEPNFKDVADNTCTTDLFAGFGPGLTQTLDLYDPEF